MDSIKANLEKALAQSEQMHQLAESSEWEQVEDLQKAHSQLVQQLVTTDFSGCDIPLTRSLLQKIRQLDQATEVLAKQRKAEIVKEKQNHDKAAKMKKAFNTFK